MKQLLSMHFDVYHATSQLGTGTDIAVLTHQPLNDVFMIMPEFFLGKVQLLHNEKKLDIWTFYSNLNNFSFNFS